MPKKSLAKINFPKILVAIKNGCVFFVKKDGSLRLVINYQVLSEVAINNNFSILLMKELLISLDCNNIQAILT